MTIFGDDVQHFKQQNYGQLRSKHQKRKTLFVDTTFPADNTSLSPGGKKTFSNVKWKRPGEISPNPKLFQDGVNAHDVCQGQLGDCWFISSMAVIACHKSYWKKIIPGSDDQEWDPKEPQRYAGIFRFRFWRCGVWTEVVIDDLLPTDDGELIFAHSKDSDEFWSALLEKAYAKLIGGYDLLIGGQEEEGMVDMTGGVPQFLRDIASYKETAEKKAELFKLFHDELEEDSLIGASIASMEGETEGHKNNGLVTTHAYSITGIRKVTTKGTGLFNLFNKDKIDLIRLRNPWGEKEWTGAFSDNSEEWKKISSGQKEKMGITVNDDGEFWMGFDDFLDNFTSAQIVRMMNTSRSLFKTVWCPSVWANDKWIKSTEDREQAVTGADFTHQYYVEVLDSEPTTICVHQIQKMPRQSLLGMGVLLIKTEVNRRTCIRTTRWCQIILDYQVANTRTLCMNRQLERGAYILVPYLREKPPEGTEVPYFFRIFTNKDHSSRILEKDLPKQTGCLASIFKSPSVTLITRIRVVRVYELIEKYNTEDIEFYCTIECEKMKLKTSVISKKTSPFVWEQPFLIYRRKPLTDPIIFKIYSKRMVSDDLIGQVSCPYTPDKLKDDALLISAPLESTKEEPSAGKFDFAMWHTESLQNL